MNKRELFKRAVSPVQYDLEDLDWEKEGSIESPRTIFYLKYLRKYISKWKEKKVLDVGSGNGWLLNEAVKAGAKEVLGLEPSKKNFSKARKHFPHINFVKVSLEDFSTEEEDFDSVIAVMSFCHIKDPKAQLDKIRMLLKIGGELIIVIPDFEYFKIPRKNYKIQIKNIDPNQYLAAITRPSGTIVDLVRDNGFYEHIAKNSGYCLMEKVAMYPTTNSLNKEKPVNQLLRFVKK